MVVHNDAGGDDDGDGNDGRVDYDGEDHDADGNDDGVDDDGDNGGGSGDIG